jgi:hypothetical protein
VKVFGCCLVVNGGLGDWVKKKTKGGARVGLMEKKKCGIFSEFFFFAYYRARAARELHRTHRAF